MRNPTEPVRKIINLPGEGPKYVEAGNGADLAAPMSGSFDLSPFERAAIADLLRQNAEATALVTALQALRVDVLVSLRRLHNLPDNALINVNAAEGKATWNLPDDDEAEAS